MWRIDTCACHATRVRVRRWNWKDNWAFGFETVVIGTFRFSVPLMILFGGPAKLQTGNNSQLSLTFGFKVRNLTVVINYQNDSATGWKDFIKRNQLIFSIPPYYYSTIFLFLIRGVQNSIQFTQSILFVKIRSVKIRYVDWWIRLN